MRQCYRKKFAREKPERMKNIGEDRINRSRALRKTSAAEHRAHVDDAENNCARLDTGTRRRHIWKYSTKPFSRPHD